MNSFLTFKDTVQTIKSIDLQNRVRGDFHLVIFNNRRWPLQLTFLIAQYGNIKYKGMPKANFLSISIKKIIDWNDLIYAFTSGNIFHSKIDSNMLMFYY